MKDFPKNSDGHTSEPLADIELTLNEIRIIQSALANLAGRTKQRIEALAYTYPKSVALTTEILDYDLGMINQLKVLFEEGEKLALGLGELD